MELIKCRNCGREFMARTNQEYCGLPECRKASHKALREGLAARPARGGSVKDCRVYEPGKKKRRSVKIAAISPERRKENEVYAYKQDCIGQRQGG